MEESYRIGDKKKSVRVKSYIISYYAQMMQVSVEDAKQAALDEMNNGLAMMPSESVTGDYVTQCLLVAILLKYKP